MKFFTFKQFLEERKVDPFKLAQRVSRRYGTRTDYGDDFDPAQKGKHIPLTGYDQEHADKVWDRIESSPNQTERKKVMKIKNLIPMQPYVRTDDPKQIKAKLADEKPSHIRVATYKGNHYVIDGHHSVMAAHLRGDTEVPVSHLNLDKK